MSRTASLAVQIGERYAPDGLRVLSNLGVDAPQTQEHGHLHVLGGNCPGPYLRAAYGGAWGSSHPALCA